MRRMALLLAAAVMFALVLTPGVAFANFAIHGSYTTDTDACAGCHRAHTSVSGINWTDAGDGTTEHSALLVSDADQIYQFCYACHGNDAQGADTNVEGGQYKGSLYGTHDALLNGGFTGDTNVDGQPKTSDHIVAGSWGAYGGGQFGTGLTDATGQDPVTFASLGTGNQITMTCASCHDPHGSSNYRLLADSVNGNAVGGYNSADQPLPYVISDEPGYPNGAGGRAVGWLKHEAGAAQVAVYTPNYTTPMYAKAPGDDVTKGMSGWCAGCHSTYTQTGTPHGTESVYDANDGWGLASRHRHPMNISLESGYGPTKSLTATLTAAADIPLPLAHDAGAVATNTPSDWIDCLTCHVAHGTSVTMSGYADNFDSQNIQPDNPLNPDKHGVAPAYDSALLRRNNRGVCEVCHNK